MPTEAVFPDQLWAGTDHSLAIAKADYSRMMAGIVTTPQPDDQEEDPPYLFTQQGDIGIISIRGSLTNRDSWINQYLGATSYPDIRRALVYAANTSDVKSILLDFDSGGGAVSGVSDTADLIATINDKVKSVYAFTDGTMASAAYWLGSSAGQVFASSTAIVGSIGVITTHMEYSKALKAEGVGATVLRAGQFKALANSIEPLTDPAIAQIQQQLDSTYAVFIGHVADRRGVTPAVADANFGQGREFMGDAALTSGIVDGIRSYDSMIGLINAKLLDTQPTAQNTGGSYIRGSTMPSPKATLSEQQLAVLAAGGGLSAEAQATADAAAALAATTAAALEAAKPAVVASVAAEVTETQKGADIVAFVQGQLTAAQAEVVALKVELGTLKAQVEAGAKAQAGLRAIAEKSLGTLRIAMSMQKLDAAALTTDSLLAEHTAASTQFAALFPVGGVAAVNTEVERKADQVVVGPSHEALIAATRFKPKK